MLQHYSVISLYSIHYLPIWEKLHKIPFLENKSIVNLEKTMEETRSKTVYIEGKKRASQGG